MRRSSLYRGRRAEVRLRLIHSLSLRAGSCLLSLSGAGHLGEGGLLEGGRLKGIGGTAFDGRTEERIQVGATAKDGRR